MPAIHARSKGLAVRIHAPPPFTTRKASYASSFGFFLRGGGRTWRRGGGRPRKDLKIRSFTGRQGRKMLRLIADEAEGWGLLLVRCAEILVTFRYQDIHVSYRRHGNCRKFFTWSMIAATLAMFLLEWMSPGITLGRGATYCHSIFHWFDAEDEHAFVLSDERLESFIAAAKKDYVIARKTTPQLTEQDIIFAEYTRREGRGWRRHPAAKVEGLAEIPAFLRYRHVLICRDCAQGRGWAPSVAGLRARLRQEGLGEYVATRSPRGMMRFGHVSENLAAAGAGQVLKLCLCSASAWELPPHSGVDIDDSDTTSDTSSTEDSSDTASDISSDSSDHADHAVACPFPGCKKTVRRRGIPAHIDSVHRPAIQCVCTVKCRFCSARVKAGGYCQHVYASHRSEFRRDHTCMLCFEAFRTAAALRSHQRAGCTGPV
eukprot:TRINITY_DN14875_c0_g1_i2.p1 TRINITY_DN14875_c0_g1~~TRINITY_DN14875_c0_g1_i2.p1  ORF type:complete len:466 (-),score=-5.79 TRINITY_DN14875_c0_g1_i2:332-1621(-)